MQLVLKPTGSVTGRKAEIEPKVLKSLKCDLKLFSRLSLTIRKLLLLEKHNQIAERSKERSQLLKANKCSGQGTVRLN